MEDTSTQLLVNSWRAERNNKNFVAGVQQPDPLLLFHEKDKEMSYLGDDIGSETY
jgi:hypothetical protein